MAFSSLRAKRILAFLVVTAPTVGAVAFFAICIMQADLTTEVAAPGGAADYVLIRRYMLLLHFRHQIVSVPM